MKSLLTNLNLVVFLLSLSACSIFEKKSVEKESSVLKVNHYNMLVVRKGKVRFIANDREINPICSKSNKRNALHSFVINKEDNIEQNGQAYCDAHSKTIVVDFKKYLEPGKYKIKEVLDPEESSLELKGYVFFKPEDSEYNSDNDSSYVGANELKEGNTEGNVNTSTGDQSDWYKISVPSFSTYRTTVKIESLNPSLELKQKGATINVYRLVEGSLRLIRQLHHKKIDNLKLEGNYFFEVKGADFGAGSKYTISLLKLSGGGATSDSDTAISEEASAPISVTDTWAVSANETAISLSKGSKDGVAKDEELKLFQGRKFIGLCKVSQLSSDESQCQIRQSIKFSKGLFAKKTL